MLHTHEDTPWVSSQRAGSRGLEHLSGMHFMSVSLWPSGLSMETYFDINDFLFLSFLSLTEFYSESKTEEYLLEV